MDLLPIIFVMAVVVGLIFDGLYWFGIRGWKAEKIQF